MKRRVDVTLLGHRFSVRSDKDEAAVHALVSHVQTRLDETKKAAKNASVQEVALLVALSLAEELFDELDRSAVVRGEVRRRTEAMVRKLERALDGDHDARARDGAADLDAADLDDAEHAPVKQSVKQFVRS